MLRRTPVISECEFACQLCKVSTLHFCLNRINYLTAALEVEEEEEVENQLVIILSVYYCYKKDCTREYERTFRRRMTVLCLFNVLLLLQNETRKHSRLLFWKTLTLLFKTFVNIYKLLEVQSLYSNFIHVCRSLPGEHYKFL